MEFSILPQLWLLPEASRIRREYWGPYPGLAGYPAVSVSTEGWSRTSGFELMGLGEGRPLLGVAAMVPLHMARTAKPFDVGRLRIVFVVSINAAFLAAVGAGRGASQAAATNPFVDEGVGPQLLRPGAIHNLDGLILSRSLAGSRAIKSPATIDFALADIERGPANDAAPHGTCTSHRIISGVRLGRASQRATQKFSGFTESNTVVRITTNLQGRKTKSIPLGSFPAIFLATWKFGDCPGEARGIAGLPPSGPAIPDRQAMGRLRRSGRVVDRLECHRREVGGFERQIHPPASPPRKRQVRDDSWSLLPCPYFTALQDNVNGERDVRPSVRCLRVPPAGYRPQPHAPIVYNEQGISIPPSGGHGGRTRNRLPGT